MNLQVGSISIAPEENLFRFKGGRTFKLAMKIKGRRHLLWSETSARTRKCLQSL
jgi:hypothetical protein